MRRGLAALLAGSLLLAAAGCGVGGSSSGSPGAPEAGELTRDAFRAAKAAGSAHYSFEASLAAEGRPPMRLRVDGAMGGRRANADVSFDGEGQSLAASLLYDRGAFFIRFLGTWYGEPAQPGRQELERELAAEDVFLEHVDDIFEGSVREGPVTDGVPTWAFSGGLDVDGFLALLAEEDALDDEAREQVEELAGSTRFTLLVGKADRLPRAYQLDVTGEGIDYLGVAGDDAGTMTATLRGSFTRWGEPVTVAPPGSYAPLEELFRQFFDF